VRLIVASEGHPNVAQLDEDMSQATVYKTLDLLKELGEVVEIDLRGDGGRLFLLRIACHCFFCQSSPGKIFTLWQSPSAFSGGIDSRSHLFEMVSVVVRVLDKVICHAPVAALILLEIFWKAGDQSHGFLTAALIFLAQIG
jgi:hypothetical protein